MKLVIRGKLPVKLVYAGQWKAVQVTENDEYACMNKAIKQQLCKEW